MNGYSYFVWFLCRASRAGALPLLGLLVAPLAARAQSARPLVLTSYYDSARTQRRVIYRARRVGADTVAHGPFRRYWPGGSLQELGHFTEGQADSVWTRYYPAKRGEKPALARRLPMRGGRPDGAFTVWYPDGRVGQRGTFRNGQLVDSLVTYDGRNRVRLAAQFQPDSAATGPSGTFQHWPRRWSYQATPGRPEPFPETLPRRYNYREYYTEEPARDPRRYWRGQLQRGQPVDTLTEFNANRQPRTQLVFDARRRLAAVLRYHAVEQLISETYDTTITRSYLAERVQALGPHRLLYQRWEANEYGTAAARNRPLGRPSSFGIYRTKTRIPRPDRPRCAPAPPTAPRPDAGPLMASMAHVGGVRRQPYDYPESALARRWRRVFAPHAYLYHITGLKKVHPRHLPYIRLWPSGRFKPRVRLGYKSGDQWKFRPRIQLWRRPIRPH